MSPATSRVLPGTPILAYHGLTRETVASTRFEVTEAAFSEHLRLIGRAGRDIARLDDWWDGRVSERGVVVTFDDGHRSDFEVALPLLAAAGASATFFVCPAWVGQKGFLTWQQVAALQDAGLSIQSHGQDHVALSVLKNNHLREQLRRSKGELESRLGSGVRFLAAPYGLASRRVVDIALAEGYEAVCTSTPWPARAGSRAISRASVDSATTAEEYTALISGRPGLYIRRSLWRFAVHIPREVLLRLAPRRLGVRVQGKLS